MVAQHGRATCRLWMENSPGGSNMGDEAKKIRRRKDIGVKIWEFSVKIRELSGNGSTKETKLDYKSVAPLLIYK